MARARTDAPPAYAWDWLTRQRVVWTEIARRLAAAPDAPTGPHPDVPDWSDLVDAGPAVAGAGATRDWSSLRTRTEVIAALRADYPHDPRVRAATDGAITDLAFLGRLDVPLAERGARAAPRGMRWWWARLGGAPAAEDAEGSVAGSSGGRAGSEGWEEPPLQLRLVDVKAGYGDGTRVTAETRRR